MCQSLQINLTPLHYAAQYGETEVAVHLINNGANLDTVDEVTIKYLLY